MTEERFEAVDRIEVERYLVELVQLTTGAEGSSLMSLQEAVNKGARKSWKLVGVAQDPMLVSVSSLSKSLSNKLVFRDESAAGNRLVLPAAIHLSDRAVVALSAMNVEDDLAEQSSRYRGVIVVATNGTQPM